MSKIHIAFSDYDLKGTYSRHVAVAMASVLCNTAEPVVVHILHDTTLSEENRRKLTVTLENAGHNSENEIIFHDLSVIYANCSADLHKICKGFSIGTTFYLNLPDILPNEDKVILLDSDTVTTLDIAELWNTDFEGKCLAAVRDVDDHPVHGIDNPEPHSHINTGVQLFNLASIREIAKGEKGYLFNRYIDYSEKYKPHFIEQEFMSAEFYGKILFISSRYNTLKKLPKEDLSVKKIWHFASLKPWKEVCGTNAEILYWKYLQKTEWADELVDSLYFAMTSGGHWHRHTSDCFRRMSDNVKREIKRGIAKIFGKGFVE